MTRTLVLCNCLGSQSIDAKDFSSIENLSCSAVHDGLCMHQQDRLQAAIAKGDTIIGCAQETDLFDEIAEELGVEPPLCVDLRDRAGWSDEGGEAGPKRAALVADALRPMPPVKTFDIVSEGICLIIGKGDVALDAARDLSAFLSVTLLLPEGSDVPPQRAFDVVTGRVRAATGALGHFSVTIDQLRQVLPGGRGDLTLGEARDGGQSQCDVILDLSGNTPLFSAPDKRDGYLRADPAHAASVARAVNEASHMAGTFEKPLYLSLDPAICAHSRAGQQGCHKCIDVCPASAISSKGDHVDVDPMICAGCGSCAALCPSGAIRFDDPPPEALFGRIAAMAKAFREAGGRNPRLLVHDTSHGAEMIALSARFGRGLSADVIPLALGRVSGFGHAEMLAALAAGFGAVDVLLSPKTETDALTREHALAQALAGSDSSLRLLDMTDPEALSEALYDAAPQAAVAPVLPLGNRRQVTRLAVKALHDDLSAPIPLPEGAPYGRVIVDTDACTLCLSCAGLCPAGALGDNPDMPQLRFQEDACLQCGLCAHVCPEKAITLEPRFDGSDAALSQAVLHEEEPFCCIDCGKPFGVKSTIDKITAKLTGQAMFSNPAALRMIQLCDDCRVQAQFARSDNPMAGAEKPRVRTTDDYLSKRRDH